MFSKNQKGASGLAILIVLSMAAFIALCVVKLYPPFYDQWTIMNIVQGFEEVDNLEELSVNKLEDMFAKRLSTNAIRGFDAEENVLIEKDEVSVYFEITYERRVNIYRNIDAIITFEESVEHVYR